MKYKDFIDIKYRPSKNDLICSFYIEPNKVSFKEAAGAVASESSVGTWTKSLSTETKEVLKFLHKIQARVFEIDGNYIKIAYPLELFELGNMPQIMSSIAGNIFGMKAVKNLRLQDVEFPKKMIHSFKGPKYGIEGIRKILKIKDRPICGTIIKPKLGLNAKQHAKVAYDAWVGGIEIVKDDENLSNAKFNNFKERVIETLKMRDKAEKETKEIKIYMPNITSETDEMLKRAEFVKKNNGEYVMLDIITLGWSALQTFRNKDFNLILHAHRAGYAALARNKKHGISMLTIAKIARLIGVDQLHIGTAVGKMEGSKKEVMDLEEEIEKEIIYSNKSEHILEQKWYNIKPVFAVASGGLHPLLVPKLNKILGNNVIMQFGGGCHGHPQGTKAGAKAIRQAIDATMQRIPLKEYSKKHEELKMAIEKWG